MSIQGDIAKEGKGSAQRAPSHTESGTRDVDATSTGFALALASVQGLHGPLTADEAPAFLSSIARARAVAEARRATSPQVELRLDFAA